MDALTSGVNASYLTGRTFHVEIITVAFMYPILLGSIPYVGPAFDSAKEDIQKLYPQLNISQTFIYDRNIRSGCGEWMTIYENLLASYYYSSRRNTDGSFDLTVFVMTGCDDILGVAQFATELDKLIISSAASLPSFADKRKWPTWITTSSVSMQTFRKVYENLIRTFNWSNLVLLCDINSNPIFPMFAGSVGETLAKSSLNQVNLVRFDSSFPAMDYTGLMRNISLLSRVVFYFGHSNPMQNLLDAAGKLNMTNGEYVYIAFLPFRHQSFGSFIWQPNSFSEPIEGKKAFKSLLLVEPLQSAENETGSLSVHWKNMSRVLYNYTYGPNELMSPHAPSTYSAMMALAEITDELRQKNSNDLHSGQQLAKHFMKRTFWLKTGRLRINEVGERIPVMTLTQTNVDTSKVVVLMEQDTESLQLRLVEQPVWPSIWPVSDRPRCGLRADGSGCQLIPQTYSSWQYGTAFGMALVFIVLFSAACFARFTRQNGIGIDGESWWILSPDRLTTGTFIQNS